MPAVKNLDSAEDEQTFSKIRKTPELNTKRHPGDDKSGMFHRKFYAHPEKILFKSGKFKF